MKFALLERPRRKPIGLPEVGEFPDEIPGALSTGLLNCDLTSPVDLVIPPELGEEPAVSLAAVVWEIFVLLVLLTVLLAGILGLAFNTAGGCIRGAVFSFVSETGVLLAEETAAAADGGFGRDSTEGILSVAFVLAGELLAAGSVLGREGSGGDFLSLAFVLLGDLVAFFLGGFSFFSFPFLPFFFGLGAKSLSSEKSEASASSKPSKLSESLSRKREKVNK